MYVPSMCVWMVPFFLYFYNENVSLVLYFFAFFGLLITEMTLSHTAATYNDSRNQRMNSTQPSWFFSILLIFVCVQMDFFFFSSACTLKPKCAWECLRAIINANNHNNNTITHINISHIQAHVFHIVIIICRFCPMRAIARKILHMTTIYFSSSEHEKYLSCWVLVEEFSKAFFVFGEGGLLHTCMGSCKQTHSHCLLKRVSLQIMQLHSIRFDCTYIPYMYAVISLDVIKYSA